MISALPVTYTLGILRVNPMCCLLARTACFLGNLGLV